MVTIHRRDAEISAEKTDPIRVLFSLRLPLRLSGSVVKKQLPYFDLPHDDGSLPAVGGVGREGSV